MKINKIMFLILICIFIVIPCISFLELKSVTNYKTKDSLSIAKCSNYTDLISKYDDLEKCSTFDFDELDPNGIIYDDWKGSNTQYSSLSLRDCCYAYDNNIPLSPDYYTIFYNLLNNTRIMNYYYIYIIGLVVFFSLYGLNKLFRSKYLYLYIQRKKYSIFMIKNVIKCYSYVIPIVLFFVILFLLSISMSGHLDRTFIVGDSTFSEIFYGNKYFLLFYCLQTCLMCMTFINVGIIFLKNNRLIFTIIKTYIVYFIVILLISKFSLVPINVLFTGKQVNIYIAVIWSFIYFGISLIAVFFSYRNKENVLTKLDRRII